jgi:fumarate reductase subunit C
MAPLYFLLLISVVLHAFIGLYRLALKWGFMEGKSTKVSRARFKILMKSFIFVYILIGLASLARYTYIGYTHDFKSADRYISKSIIIQEH